MKTTLIIFFGIFIPFHSLLAQENLVRNPQFAEVFIDYNARDWSAVYRTFIKYWDEIGLYVNNNASIQIEEGKYYTGLSYIRKKPEIHRKMMTHMNDFQNRFMTHNDTNGSLHLPLNDGVLRLAAYGDPIATKLREPLLKGDFYEMKVRIIPDLASRYTVESSILSKLHFQNFFFLLTYGSTKHLKTRDGTSNKSNFDTLSQSRFFEQRQRDSLGWETWTCRFVASDSARYLTLAARWPKNTSSPQKVGRGFFYIDSVSLRAMTDTETTQHYDSLEANKQLLKLLELGALGFEYNKSALSPLGKKKLDSLATALKKEPSFQKLVLDGHTDKAGSPDYNKSLSQARAKAVQNYLVSKGLATELFYLRAYGSEKPVSTKPELNRRVEIKMLR